MTPEDWKDMIVHKITLTGPEWDTFLEIALGDEDDHDGGIYCPECGSCGDFGCCFYACDQCVVFHPSLMKRVTLKDGKERIRYKDETEEKDQS